MDRKCIFLLANQALLAPPFCQTDTRCICLPAKQAFLPLPLGQWSDG
jgi:hypothetical protein